MNEEMIRTQNSVKEIGESIDNYKTLYKTLQPLCELQNELQNNLVDNVVFTFGQELTKMLFQINSIMNVSWITFAENIQYALTSAFKPLEQLNNNIKTLYDSAHIISNVLENYNLLYLPKNNFDEDDIEEEEVNTKVIKEIFKTNQEDPSNDKPSGIITLSPVNDTVLKYLSENPQAFYQLTDTDFEIVMAEIYSKLGYNVERTQSTRDGGKDIIIRKPEILGDFIYYVECKKYAPKRHIGVGIIRNLVGTISTDRVNGGILATTSYFTQDARKFVLNNNYGYQIQMHDYDAVRRLLDKAIK